MNTATKMGLVSLTLGWILVAIGHGMGLFVAPAEAMMGDVGRILYVHVPTAWIALLTFLVAFIAAIGTMLKDKASWEAFMAASVEVGVILNLLLLAQGSIWARPTWGVFWTWDPRLTTTAIMAVGFGVVLLLRSIIDDPERRRTISAIATIIAFVDVPIVYFSIKWWRTLHQDFSSPETVDMGMVLPLRIAAFGMLFLAAGFILIRSQRAFRQINADNAAPDLPERPEALVLDTNENTAPHPTQGA